MALSRAPATSWSSCPGQAGFPHLTGLQGPDSWAPHPLQIRALRSACCVAEGAVGPLSQPSQSRAGCTRQETDCSPGTGFSVITSLSKASLFFHYIFPQIWQGILPLRPFQLKSPQRTHRSSLHPVMFPVALKICFWCVCAVLCFSSFSPSDSLVFFLL